MIEFFLDPLANLFIVRSLAAATMIGVVGAVVGAYVVLRGMAFFGDALAHAILPGISAGYLIHNGARAPLFWWALISAILSSLGIGAISRSTKIKEDTAIGIIFAGSFALGIVLLSTVTNYTVDLAHFLFGNILALTNRDLGLIFVFGGLVLLAVWAFYKEFMVLSFDPILAATLRLPVRLLESLLLVLIAVTIVVSLQSVGVALMVAMLVTPAATAQLLTKRLPTMMGLGAAISAFSGVIGIYLSYYLSIAAGAVIVLTCTVFFGFVWGIQTLRKAA